MKKDEKKLNNIKLTGTFLSLAFISIALVLAIYVGVNRTFSWFMRGGNNTATGMAVRTHIYSFELARTYDTGFSNDLKTYLQNTYDFDDETSTSSSNYSIICELISEHGADEDNSIYPGAYGTVTFYIIPEDSNELTLDFSFERIGIKCHEVQPYFRDIDAAVSSDVYDLLNGHILLFKQRTQDGSAYRYSKRLMDGFTFNSSEINDADYDMNITWDQSNGRYQVTLYWIWPATFSQIAYDATESSMGVPALFSTGSADRTAMFTYMDGNRNEFFYNLSSVVPTPFPDNFQVTYNTFLSDGYNNGDQLIGDNVDYYILKITATPGSTAVIP